MARRYILVACYIFNLGRYIRILLWRGWSLVDTPKVNLVGSGDKDISQDTYVFPFLSAVDVGVGVLLSRGCLS
ncbi:hypothetical protein GGS20DRAFT_538825 [Poronia punctata]|nr:hypothetical protein GGS20DRAFT_538825 [Poronia punctata]